MIKTFNCLAVVRPMRSKGRQRVEDTEKCKRVLVKITGVSKEIFAGLKRLVVYRLSRRKYPFKSKLLKNLC